MRGRMREVLVHSREAIDLSFLSSGRAPVLLDHDPGKQIGVVETVSLDEREGVLRAVVRFGRSVQASDVLTDIQDGIRQNVSIGYSIEDADEEGIDFRVIRWRPFEVSIVSIPADVTVGVGRSDDKNLAPNKKGNRGMTKQVIKLKELSARDAAEIVNLGHVHNMVGEAQRAVENGTSLSEFVAHVRRSIPEDRAIVNFDVGPRIEDQEAESAFDLGRFLRGKITNDWSRAGRELEVATELTRSQKGTRGMVVPADALAVRAAMTTTGGASALVTTEHRGDLFIEALRPASFALSAGATMLGGLTSNVSIPRATAAPTASWVAEGGAITEGNGTFDNVPLNATMLAARVSMTRQALLQGIPQLDNLVKQQINMQFASALDAAVIAGSGAGAVPTGIENVTGINAFTAGAPGAVTWAEVVQAWRTIAEDDVAPDSSMAWVGHPTVAEILRGTLKDPGSGQFIMGDRTENRDGSVVSGQVMGVPFFETSHATSSILTLGRFSDVLIGQFGGVDFVVDEFTDASTGVVTIYAYAFFDINVRHPNAFCTITGI